MHEMENSKSGRIEWVNVKYHSLYDPDQAFEMIIEWMVSTGNAIPEMVFAWNRNKNTNLHIGKWINIHSDIIQTYFSFVSSANSLGPIRTSFLKQI